MDIILVECGTCLLGRYRLRCGILTGLGKNNRSNFKFSAI
jgi:hypothetical protein